MRERWSKLLVAAVVLLLVYVAPASAAFELSWQDTLSSAQTWHRPTADMQQAASGAPTPYSVQSIFVDRSGTYQVDSDQPGTVVPFHGYVFLYAGAFDPALPLLNLVAGSDGGPDGVSPSHIAGILTAGAVYHVVTTSDDPLAGRFSDTVSGPGEIHVSSCAAHALIPAGGPGSLSLVGGHFCVGVTYKDAAGVVHAGVPVNFRSDASTAFWFFTPNSWEVQVKVVDGCFVNQRSWVMLAGTTDVDYTVTVEDITLQSSTPVRTYHSAKGSLRSIFDVQAFDGCPAKRKPR
ncbi:MAG TPA: hypothetical protein VH988_33210 [Thermoanaerobaculia bacterium]|jgi:hypothetical protein|nr:hypothetical protein [Thermoanaerobaculia bacterium]